MPIPGSRLWPKKWKISLFNGYSACANMLSTSFWLIMLSVWVKIYRSLKIKFFFKVKNKVHVTIAYICDSHKTGSCTKMTLKQKFSDVLWNFALSNTQMMDSILTNNFIYFVWNSIVGISFDVIFCLVTFVTFLI